MELPARIGKYELREFRGGGMSHVFRATDTVLGRQVAVKILTETGAADPEEKARFLQEARLGSILVHENIVSVYDFGEDSGRPFLVMEWVQGESLAAMLKRGPFELRRGLETGLQLARALEAIHARKIVHRDIKPENIQIDTSGRVKLMDFGIAKSGGLRLTRVGHTLGTPYYMAPEQILGQQVAEPADIWSFGLVLFELLSGRRAIQGDSVERLFYTVLNESIDLQPLTDAGVPAPIVRLVQQCTIRDPRERIANFTLIIRTLEEALSGYQITPSPRAPAQPAPAERPGLLARLAGLFRRRSDKQSEPTSEVAQTIVRPSPPAAVPAPPPKMPDPPVPLPGRSGPAEFTQMFRTEPVAREAPAAPAPPLVHEPASVGEFTRMFSVGPPKPPGEESPEPAAAPDVALKITACIDPAFLGQSIRLNKFPFRFGRPGRDYTLGFDPAVSRDHFEIDFVGSDFIIRDLGSSNGTFVEETQLETNVARPLLLSKRIRIGTNTELTFVPYRSDELPDLRNALIRGRYRLTELLQNSWKSAVYKGRHEEIEQLVLVKILVPSLRHHSGYSQQFQSLARTASSLVHPHITRILDFGETDLPGGDRTLCVVIQYLEGGSLSDRNMPVQAIADCVEKIASALEYAHARDITHGGIKPAAIVFDSQDNPYLTDFALPVLVGGKSVIAAPAYMAPEQWSGEKPLPATDQYSLAATIYAALTGADPYVGQENAIVRQRNFLQGAIPAHEMAVKNGRALLPAGVSEVLGRALALKPEDRFPSVQHFARAFRATLNESAPAARRKLVFISYHRADSSLLSLMLKDHLAEETPYEIFLDSEQQDRTGQFPPKLQRKIEQCDVFVCLLARGTLKAPWVNNEIMFAHAAKRPMIPVFQESFRFPKDRESLAPHIRELIDSGGERVQDLQNRYVRESIRTVAGMIRQVVDGGR